MAKHAKLIGEVIPLSGPYPGYAVRVTRYPSGRMLPAPRLILCSKGHPFATQYAALEALGMYVASPKLVKQLKACDPVPVPPTRAPKALPMPKPEPTVAEKRAARRRVLRDRAKLIKPLPEITKMAPVPAQRLTKALKKPALATAHLLAHCGVTVTRCPDGARQSDSRWPVAAR